MDYPRFNYSPQQFSDVSTTDIAWKLWAMVTRPENVLLMEGAAFVKKPAAEILTLVLLKELENPDQLNDRQRQMLGHMIRQVMEQIGYVIDKQRVMLRRNEIFTTATRYKKNG